MYAANSSSASSLSPFPYRTPACTAISFATLYIQGVENSPRVCFRLYNSLKFHLRR